MNERLQPDELIHRYFDEVATEREIEELNALLAADSNVALRFAETASLHGALYRQFATRAPMPKEFEREAAELRQTKSAIRAACSLPVKRGARRAPRVVARRVETPNRQTLLYGAGAAIAAALLLCVFLWNSATVPPPAPEPEAFASVVRTAGEAKIFAGGVSRVAQRGDRVLAGQVLEADGSSGLVLKCEDGTMVEVNANTTVEIVADKFKHLKLSKGIVACQVSKQPYDLPFTLTTPHADVLVVGTVFKLSVLQDATDLAVARGRIHFVRREDRAAIDVSAGERSIAKHGVALSTVPFDPGAMTDRHIGI